MAKQIRKAKAKTKSRKKEKAQIDADKLWFMYRKMNEIRFFEENVWDVYTRGLMPGLAHLYIGEEGVAVGTCAALRDDDYITSTHRGHGHCLAKGGELDRMMAEIMGKETGYCRGKGGSMHIADMSVGILGANGIVGGGFGISTGAALSAKKRGTDQVAVCFFGDGAANQGIMLETLNMAVIWDLPVIYVCENNQYGEHTSYRKVTGVEDIAQRAEGLGIEGVITDGSDVLGVYQTVSTRGCQGSPGQGSDLGRSQDLPLPRPPRGGWRPLPHQRRGKVVDGQQGSDQAPWRPHVQNQGCHAGRVRLSAKAGRTGSPGRR